MTDPTPHPRDPWKTVALASLVVAIAAVVITVVSVFLNWQRTSDTQQLVVQLKTDRTAARLSACHSYNDDLVTAVNGLNDQDQSLVHDTFTGLPAYSTPEGKAIIDQYVGQRNAKYEAVKIAPRDCTPAGIAAYYAKRSR